MLSLERVLLNRRSKARFGIRLRVHFSVMSQRIHYTGAGWVVNISSSVVFVECPQHVDAGTRMGLRIDLPTLLDGLIPLQLIAIGRVVRSEKSWIPLAMAQCHYRTKARRSQRKGPPK